MNVVKIIKVLSPIAMGTIVLAFCSSCNAPNSSGASNRLDANDTNSSIVKSSDGSGDNAAQDAATPIGKEAVFKTRFGRLAMRKLTKNELQALLRNVNMAGVSYRSDETFGSKYFQGVITFHENYYCLNIPSDSEECFEIYVDHQKRYFAVAKGDPPPLNADRTEIEPF